MINLKDLNNRKIFKKYKEYWRIYDSLKHPNDLRSQTEERKRIVATNVLNLMENINQTNLMKQNFQKILI